VRTLSLATILLLALASARAADEPDPMMLAAEADALFKMRKYDDALAKLDVAIKKDAKFAQAYYLRGRARYMKGDFKGSAADFDKQIDLRPKDFERHWERGITLYYLGRHEEGRKQFEGYEKTDTSDVENTFWHWMCAYKKGGEKAAREGLLKTGKDKRPPMNEVLGLLQGKIKPDDVMKAADAGDLTEAQRKPRRFYGHLYLGLYFDVTGDRKKAIEHLDKAAGEYQIGHYMGEVARVHRDWLKGMK